MMYRAALLALVLLSALVAGPPTAADLPTASMDETAVLTLEEPTTDARVSSGVDVGAAIALGGERGAARLDRYEFEARLDSSDDPAQVVRRAANETAAAVERLYQRETAARRAYVDGTSDQETFLREIAVVDARAELIEARLAQIQAAADELAGVSLREQLAGVSAGVVVISGPVRDRAAASVLGQADPIPIGVSANDNGEILAMIAGDQYVRETTRIDHWTASETERFGLDRAIGRIQTLYPTAYNESLQTGINVIGAGIYRIEMRLSGASIVAHLDGDTEQVFAEVQTRRLDLGRAGPVTVATANGTRLLVNRTIPGGPLRVATVDNSTGAPVASTVVIGDVSVETGPDGIAWTLAPRRVQFPVTAIGPNGSVTTPVRPLEVTAVGS